jgi:hypothetical protein
MKYFLSFQQLEWGFVGRRGSGDNAQNAPSGRSLHFVMSLNSIITIIHGWSLWWQCDWDKKKKRLSSGPAT